MPLSRFGFIIKADGYSPAIHHTELTSTVFHSQIIGVSDLADAFVAAQQLVLNNIELIELCAGFSQDEAELLRQSIGYQVPIGVVCYTPEQAATVQQLFA